MIWSSSWKSTRPKTRILQEGFPYVITALVMVAVLWSHSISTSKTEVLVEGVANGHRPYRSIPTWNQAITNTRKGQLWFCLAKAWESPRTLHNLLGYPVAVLPFPSSRFFLPSCLIWNSRNVISGIGRELKLQFHYLVLNMKIKYEKSNKNTYNISFVPPDAGTENFSAKSSHNSS